MPEFKLTDLIITRVCSVHAVNLPHAEKWTRKNRERWALAYKAEGETAYHAAGKTYASDARHMVLLPQGATYFFTCAALGVCRMIEFEAQAVEASAPQSYEVVNPAEMLNRFSRLESNWTFKKPAYPLRCMAGLYEILACLETSRPEAYPLSSKYSIIEPAVNYLEAHYAQSDLSLDRLAAMAGVSPVYFRKIFTSIYHTPPMTYVRAVRIQKAKDMLASDFPSISGVAEAVGIGSLYQFSKLFKQTTGFSPTEYARAHGGRR